MLLAALRQTSGSVTVDVLTTVDLEAMRADIQRPAAQPPAGAPDRRYLILTHSSDFDRAHYPLPLSQSDRSRSGPADQVRICATQATTAGTLKCTSGHTSDAAPCQSLPEAFRVCFRRRPGGTHHLDSRILLQSKNTAAAAGVTAGSRAVTDGRGAGRMWARS